MLQLALFYEPIDLFSVGGGGGGEGEGQDFSYSNNKSVF
jgi:hypothetical protein